MVFIFFSNIAGYLPTHGSEASKNFGLLLIIENKLKRASLERKFFSRKGGSPKFFS